MALIHAQFYSPVLSKQVGLCAITPEVGAGPFPVYYLLHGFSDDYASWQRNSRIESYVSALPLIVVMPDGFHGFYCDNVAGPAYAQYLMQDVFGFVERTLPVSAK